MEKALVIQTAFLGDVILATPVIEKLHKSFPGIEIDFLLRKGNQAIFENHPHLRKVMTFDKSAKWDSFWNLQKQIKDEQYDLVINLHRFFTSGMLSVLSGANMIIGFDRNPLSFFYHKKYAYRIEPESMLHEVDRNLTLLAEITDGKPEKPKLYPSHQDYAKAFRNKPYICIAPASKWYTKQWPIENWVLLLSMKPGDIDVLLIGSDDDRELCNRIAAKDPFGETINCAGDYSLLEVAALMENAKMNFVNDSAPLHIASAMNAPVSAVFCSTIPGFGFYPLSDNSFVAETNERLSCRPCGIHGRKKCPEGHFRCVNVPIEPLLDRID
ncbi:MAG: glycosyltransferase family 9 protein [Saprospirales bacterium]|nr:MAG: glycosyltransferase family 9 protein [Saprospirales bacterium]